MKRKPRVRRSRSPESGTRQDDSAVLARLVAMAAATPRRDSPIRTPSDNGIVPQLTKPRDIQSNYDSFERKAIIEESSIGSMKVMTIKANTVLYRRQNKDCRDPLTRCSSNDPGSFGSHLMVSLQPYPKYGPVQCEYRLLRDMKVLVLDYDLCEALYLHEVYRDLLMGVFYNKSGDYTRISENEADEVFFRKMYAYILDSGVDVDGVISPPKKTGAGGLFHEEIAIYNCTDQMFDVVQK